MSSKNRGNGNNGPAAQRRRLNPPRSVSFRPGPNNVFGETHNNPYVYLDPHSVDLMISRIGNRVDNPLDPRIKGSVYSNGVESNLAGSESLPENAPRLPRRVEPGMREPLPIVERIRLLHRLLSLNSDLYNEPNKTMILSSQARAREDLQKLESMSRIHGAANGSNAPPLAPMNKGTDAGPHAVPHAGGYVSKKKKRSTKTKSKSKSKSRSKKITRR